MASPKPFDKSYYTSWEADTAIYRFGHCTIRQRVLIVNI